jgi:hypothetical protein
MKFRWLIVFVFLMPVMSRAAPTAEEMANQARACRDRAGEVMSGYDNLVAACSYHAEFTRADLKLAKPAYEGESALWKKMGDAWEKGDVEGAQTLRKQTDRATQIVSRWRERLDARVKESEVAPHEGFYIESNLHSAAAAKPALGALYDIQCAAAEAWCGLAEAMTPEADADRIDELREKALAAADEVELARSAWEALNRREVLLADQKKPTDQVRQAVEQLKKLDDERQQAKRQQMEQSRRLRQIERRTVKMEAQLRQEI